MFASIRRYVLERELIGDFARLVEVQFADRIAIQPGFLWYALLDCGRCDVITISVFRERAQAAGSLALARGFTESRLSDSNLTLTTALDGAIPVSRSTPKLMKPTWGRFARIRRYGLGAGVLDEVVWRIVDTRLAERMAKLQGFVAYFVFSPGASDLVTVSVFDDYVGVSGSDEIAMAFVRYDLDHLDIHRVDMIGGGEIIVSRASQELLQPPA
jgi:hypothetical protein